MAKVYFRYPESRQAYIGGLAYGWMRLGYAVANHRLVKQRNPSILASQWRTESNVFITTGARDT